MKCCPVSLSLAFDSSFTTRACTAAATAAAFFALQERPVSTRSERDSLNLFERKAIDVQRSANHAEKYPVFVIRKTETKSTLSRVLKHIFNGLLEGTFGCQRLHDVSAPQEFPLHEELREGGPFAEDLDALQIQDLGSRRMYTES